MFDTSVPSYLWNRVIRAQKLPEQLCLICIIQEFVKVNQPFTAVLWGAGLDGTTIEIRTDQNVVADSN